MLDDSPRCQECGVELEGRDVYEGICKSCREDMILSGRMPKTGPAKAHAAPEATGTPPPLPGQVSMEEDTKEMDAIEPPPEDAGAASPPPEEAPAPTPGADQPAPGELPAEQPPLAPEPEAEPAEKAPSPLLTGDEEDVDLEPLALEFEDSEATESSQVEAEPKAEAPSEPPPASPEPSEAAAEQSAAEAAEDYVPSVLPPEQEEAEPAAKTSEEPAAAAPQEPAPAAPQEADTDAVEVEEEQFLRLRVDTEEAASRPGPSAERSVSDLREEVQQLRLRLQGLSARLEKAERSSRGGRGPLGFGFRFAIGLVLGLGVLALLVGGGMYAVGKLVHPPTLEFLQRLLDPVWGG